MTRKGALEIGSNNDIACEFREAANRFLTIVFGLLFVGFGVGLAIGNIGGNRDLSFGGSVFDWLGGLSVVLLGMCGVFMLGPVVQKWWASGQSTQYLSSLDERRRETSDEAPATGH